MDLPEVRRHLCLCSSQCPGPGPDSARIRSLALSAHKSSLTSSDTFRFVKKTTAQAAPARNPARNTAPVASAFLKLDSSGSRVILLSLQHPVGNVRECNLWCFKASLQCPGPGPNGLYALHGADFFAAFLAVLAGARLAFFAAPFFAVLAGAFTALLIALFAGSFVTAFLGVLFAGFFAAFLAGVFLAAFFEIPGRS